MKSSVQSFFDEVHKNTGLNAEISNIKNKYEEYASGPISSKNSYDFLVNDVIPIACKYDFNFTLEDYIKYHLNKDLSTPAISKVKKWLSENGLSVVSAAALSAIAIMLMLQFCSKSAVNTDDLVGSGSPDAAESSDVTNAGAQLPDTTQVTPPIQQAPVTVNVPQQQAAAAPAEVTASTDPSVIDGLARIGGRMDELSVKVNQPAPVPQVTAEQPASTADNHITSDNHTEDHSTHTHYHDRLPPPLPGVLPPPMPPPGQIMPPPHRPDWWHPALISLPNIVPIDMGLNGLTDGYTYRKIPASVAGDTCAWYIIGHSADFYLSLRAQVWPEKISFDAGAGEVNTTNVCHAVFNALDSDGILKSRAFYSTAGLGNNDSSLPSVGSGLKVFPLSDTEINLCNASGLISSNNTFKRSGLPDEGEHYFQPALWFHLPETCTWLFPPEI